MTEALWTAVTSWFTPTVLFCVLNLTIATIYVTSSFKNQRKQEQKQSRVISEDDDPATAGQLFRVPSLLERVKSINFSRYSAEQPNPSSAETTTQYEEHVIEQVETMKDDDEDMIYDHVERSKSLTSSMEAPVRKQAKMKKSLSEKMAGSTKEEEENLEWRRPATVRERKAKWDETTSSVGEDEAVDAKADDFINRFKQQLKLQRIDSILRRSGVAR